MYEAYKDVIKRMLIINDNFGENCIKETLLIIQT